jgi:hypothetical protein
LGLGVGKFNSLIIGSLNENGDNFSICKKFKINRGSFTYMGQYSLDLSGW